MHDFKKHLILQNSTISEALVQLESLSIDALLFIVDDQNTLKGSLSDGDLRRGFINGFGMNDPLIKFYQKKTRFIRDDEKDITKLISFREDNLRVLPILNKKNRIVNVLNFRLKKSYLPIDIVIMAGGKGTRLKPLTDNTPKPLLKVGDKSIMEHNIDRLTLFGVDDFWISVKYLGNQIVDYFGDGKKKNISIDYVWEDEPLGTIGAVSKINNFKHEHLLVTNSDILTNLDYEAFYLDFINQDADFAIVSIPYNVSIPYAVLETSEGHVLDFKEKPTYTYFSNGGIYLMKNTVLDYIPKETHFNATDLIEKLILEKKKVISYPHEGYWLDVGNHADFEKAQKNIVQINWN